MLPGLRLLNNLFDADRGLAETGRERESSHRLYEHEPDADS